MEDIDYKQFAKEFITNWQENFAKTMQDPEIIQNLTKAMGFMQQFYDKSTTTTTSATSHSRADELHWQQLNGRIRELEERIAELEAGSGGKRSKKKTT